MRDYQIKIQPFEYTALQKLEILREINNHAVAKITMRIRDELKDQYMAQLMSETWVRILAAAKEEESMVYTILFHGIVTDFSFQQDGYETILNLEIKSGTILMDLTPHFRVFQNEQTFCTSIHEK